MSAMRISVEPCVRCSTRRNGAENVAGNIDAILNERENQRCYGTAVEEKKRTHLNQSGDLVLLSDRIGFRRWNAQ